MTKDYNLINKSPTVVDYTALSVSNLPVLFLGASIRNQFDEEMYRINKTFKPKRVSHFSWDGSELSAQFFYGIEVIPLEEQDELIRDISNFYRIFLDVKDMDHCIEIYRRRLLESGISAEECWSKLDDGIYPIDLCCLSKLVSRKTYNQLEFIENIIDTQPDNTPFNVIPLSLFIFGPSVSYAIDSK
tara:strand:+ start:4276 stop:4836 length:561 start_codon:yes stop_codon:yes gene_type:complete